MSYVNLLETFQLVVKSGIDAFNKSIILGALDYAQKLIQHDNTYKDLFEGKGDILFLAAE